MKANPGLQGKRWLIGVSGGIAAYKVPTLVRRMRDQGAEVSVVMTAAARQFITPLTLQAASGHPVHWQWLDHDAEAGMGHIDLARWADGILIAPATAHLIGRLAHGLADDLLTTLVLASEAPLWLAPAMNRVMWAHPAVQANCRLLAERGVELLGPGEGDQACGEIGPGRMLEPEAMVSALAASDDRRLAGLRAVVTAGPTHEPLDPVRFLGNRSSGRMGFAVAQALARAGAEVDLIAGPVSLETPSGVRRIAVETADQMHSAVFQLLPGADLFIGVAAVADYRPEVYAEHKLKKDSAPRELRLVPNPDILAEVASSAHRPSLVMGFAAETRDLERNARSKLAQKGLDLIAANRVGDGLAFNQAENALEVYSAERHWRLDHQPKQRLAEQLVDILVEALQAKHSKRGKHETT